MSYSYTGIAYLISFFALSFLSFKFYQYWQERKDIVSKLFFLICAIFALHNFWVAVVGIFFANSLEVLRFSNFLTSILQGLDAAVIMYFIFYLKSIKISPWWGFSAVCLLGISNAILGWVLPSHPYLDVASLTINWDNSLLVGTFRSLLFFAGFVPLIIITLRQMKRSTDPLLKKRTIGLILVFSLALITGLFDFLLEKTLNLPLISSDIALAILSLVTFFVVFVTNKNKLS